MRVHFLHAPDPQVLDVLESLLNPQVELSFGELADRSDIDILIAGRPARDDIEACLSLRALIIPFAGLPPQTRTLMHDFPQVAVYNLPHNAGATAETALALLFGAAKFLVPYDREFRRHDWSRRYGPSNSLLLEGKTALVIGFGAIGQRLGRVCHALGMQIIGVRRSTGQMPLDFPVEVHTLDDLPDLLPRTHVLLVALPGTPETEGLIGEAELRSLPPGAVLVNVGRGAVVDQAALYQALKDGHLRAAGLDVWYHYPASLEARTNTPPADYPFHELDNVVLSPHRGGDADEIETLRMQALAELLNTAEEGRTMPGRVDVQAGY